MTYDITTRELAQQPVLSIRERRVQRAIPEFLGGAFDELFGTLGLSGRRRPAHPWSSITNSAPTASTPKSACRSIEA